MNRLLATRLKNIVFFKQAEFKFKPGLYGILGRNMNRRDPESSNGSGKSLLMGVIPNAWFDSHAHITKNVKSVQKNIYGKGSAVEFDFIPHGVKTKYTYIKAGSKVRLLQNGEDMDSRVARDSMREKLHLSEEELFATVYVDSSRPNSFLMGNASDRFNFMTGLFRLDDIDEMRKIFGRKITDLRETAAALSVLQSEFGEARAELAKYPKQSVEQVAEMQAKLKKAQEMLQRATQAIHGAEQYAQWKKAKAALDAIERPSLTRNEAREAVAAWRRFEAEEKAYKEGLARQERLKQELDALNVKHLLPELDAKLKLREAAHKAKCPPPGKEPPKPVDGADKAFAKLTALRARVAKLRAQIADREQSLSDFNEHFHADDAECPTCTQLIDKGAQKRIQASLQASVDELQEELRKYSSHLSNALAYEKWNAWAEADANHFKYKALLDKIDGYPFDDVIRFRAGLESLRKIQFKRPVRPGILFEQADTALGVWEMIERAKSVLSTLGNPDPPEWGVEQAKKIKATAEKNVAALMEVLPKLQSKLELRKQTIAKCKRLDKEIKESQRAVVDLPVYEMLQKAYSPQGIKLLIIKSIANTLQSNLNRYAKQVFEEPFKFKINVESGKFDVLVERKGMPECDVKFFSGAERRLFVFVFLLALLPMIPAKRRMNFLVLDEPCANMDVGTQARFRDVLLKALKKIVPCVVVVTPNEHDLPHGTKFYTVVKRGTEATLVEGKVK